jgi:hypothetical protein
MADDPLPTPPTPASPDPERGVGRWLAAHPRATLLEIAAFVASGAPPDPPATADGEQRRVRHEDARKAP